MSRLDSLHQALQAKAQLRGEISPKRQPQWLTEAVAVTVHATRGQVKAIAAALNEREDAVYRVADINDPSPLKAAWIPAICQETNTYAILDALEAQVGRVAFPLHLPSDLDHSALHAHLSSTVQQFGDVLHVTGSALADGRLDAAEHQHLIDEIDEAVRALCAYRAVVTAKAQKDAAA